MMSLIYLLSVLRGLLVVMVLVPATVVFSVNTMIFAIFFKAPDLAFLLVARYWARPIMLLAGIEIEYREESGQPEKGFLYLFNHTSYNDIMAMLVGLPKPPMFGAKAELFKIPFFGPAMASMKFLKIERDKRAKVLQMYKEAKSRVEAGERFALAPEGTRQDGDDLGKFKRGPFIFALEAEMPMVPLVIAGARQTQPKGSYLMNLGAWKRKIIVKALSPVDAKNYTEETMSDMQELVFQKMNTAYLELQKELGVRA